jgi:hypothetical protein
MCCGANTRRSGFSLDSGRLGFNRGKHDANMFTISWKLFIDEILAIGLMWLSMTMVINDYGYQ